MTIQDEIRTVQRDTTLSSKDKMDKIRKLMANQCKQNISSITDTSKTENTKIDFRNAFVNIQCSHYVRGCHVFCDICKKYYPCRLCHDANESHKIDRFTIKQIICRGCKKVQTPSEKCIHCGKLFGFYFCSHCNLWECADKKIFHCDKCGLCRIGKTSDYIHCDKCNMCLEVNHYYNHKCIENSTKTNCPICNEYMFDSVNKPVEILKCGHSIHEECFKDMISKNQYKCPLCKKSIMNMSQQWLAKDQLKDFEMIPMHFRHKRLIIFCNDCEQKSDIGFSFEFRKCNHCRGYNTNEIEQYET